MVKAGLDAFSKSLAQELAGREILVNAVAPGFIETDMTAELPEAIRGAILARIPQQRMGRPDEVADAVTWLATRASYVNGCVLHVNGGSGADGAEAATAGGPHVVDLIRPIPAREVVL
jgi:3-oxoacyl-[acyl-carrier protein] reductase